MKLSNLYCNKKNFKNIRFNLSGINVVFAEVKSQADEKKNSHDLGKTKLTEIIDFMLLKEVNQKTHFLFKITDENETSIFHDYIFYLELLLNSGTYLTIKRNVEYNTKISFSLNEERTVNFSTPAKWDHENITIRKAKDILSDYLSIDFFKNKEYDFRKSISYSLRTQDDFQDVYKLNKFSGKDVYWKPFMFDLLGFNGKLLQDKYDNDFKIENIKLLIDSLKKEYSVKIEERDEIVAEKSIVESKFKEIEKQIDRFNFYQQDKDLINNGIEKIENQISNLNSESYKLNYELDRLKNSIKNNFSFDMNKVNKVFEETQIFFPDELKGNYLDLIEFNKKLTSERNKILRKTIKEKEEQLNELNSDLIKLNNEREKLLQHLTDSDTFTKFKYHQKELVKVESTLIKLNEKLKIIDTIIDKENEIEILQNDIKSTINKIKSIFQRTNENDKYSSIRTSFTYFYKKIMDEDAYISWNINSNNNVDFTPPKIKSKIDTKLDTAKDEGNTYKKILCVAFDLAILISYSQESYYRFVYHDDVLSQQDNGIKIRLLELIEEINSKYSLQYIFSVINSDLPIDKEDKFIKFTDENIVLRLHDKDPSGTLFGFEF